MWPTGRVLLFLVTVASVQLPVTRLEALLSKSVTAHHQADPTAIGHPWAGVEPYVGLKCTADQPEAGCGTAYVCRDDQCTHCRSSKDCKDMYACIPNAVTAEPTCVPRELMGQWQASDTVCTVLIVLTAMLSAAAGLGGGGVYVPLTILLVGLTTTEAVPLSQTLVLGGAIVNCMLFFSDRHPKHPEQPKIAYDVIMMLNPGLAAGVVLGVLGHLIAPAWLTLSCLLVTLVFAFQKSFTRGCKLFAQECKDHAKAAEEKKCDSGNGGSGGDAEAGVPPTPPRGSIKATVQDAATKAKYEQAASVTSRQITCIVLCWAAFLAINMAHPARCTGAHWAQLACFVAVAVGFTMYAQKATHLHNGNLNLDGTAGMKYAMMAVLAGFLGGFLGIGGGLVMGPVLLELGLMPEVSQATTPVFVLLSSSLGTAQFILLGKEMPYFVAWYAFWVTAATVVGQIASDWLIKKYNHTSFIIFAVSGVVLASAVMMVWVGSVDVMQNFADNAYMGLSPQNICMGH